MIEPPLLPAHTIDNVFAAEEMIKACEPLVQNTFRNLNKEYRRIQGEAIEERAVLG